MFRFGYFLPLLLLSASLHAQISIGQFIKSGERATEIQIFNSQIEYLSTKPYRLAPIQKLEFRTKNNQLDPARQDYAIRINPANPWEVRNNTNYFKAFQSALSFEKDIIFKEALIERYTMITELLYFISLRKLHEEKRGLTDAQVGILEKQQGSTFFDAKDYLELKVDQMTNMVEIEEAQYEIDRQARRIGIKYSGSEPVSVNWDSEHVISVERIEQVVDSLLYDELPSAEASYKEQKIRVATAEYKLEKANIGVGFFRHSMNRIAKNRGVNPGILLSV
jgi:hypothetical protein